jgi:hypothetical protein
MNLTPPPKKPDPFLSHKSSLITFYKVLFPPPRNPVGSFKDNFRWKINNFKLALERQCISFSGDLGI